MTRLRRAAILAFVIHLIAGAGMAIVLSHGLETNSDFISRLNFIVNHRVAWTLGWLAWTAAALSILYFYNSYASAHHLGTFGVLVTAAAIVADISAHTIEIAVIPGIAFRTLRSEIAVDLFILLHRIAVLLSGYLANGLYSLSALLLSWSTRSIYPPRVLIPGLTVSALGFALSIAAILGSTTGLFWTNAVLIPTLLLWLLAVATATFPSHLQRTASQSPER